MKFHEMTSGAIGAIDRKQTVVLFPIAAVEQHGPHLPTGTDLIICGAVAEAVEARNPEKVLMLPVNWLGASAHHLRFGATMTAEMDTYIATLCEMARAPLEDGFQRILFLNGHGGNIATLNAAFYEIYADPPPGPGGRPAAVRCTLLNWFLGPGVGQLSRDLFGNKEGSHATPSEVALTQHVYPDQVKVAVLDPETAPAGGFYDADDFRRRYPDGRIGSAPGLATPAKGAQVLEAAVADALSAWSAFQEDA